MNGYVVGAASWLLGNIFGTGKAVSALLMSSVELGILLLAIASLCIPRRCSGVVERGATWLSTWLRRSARKVASKRWEWPVDGLVLVVGRGPDDSGWHHRKMGVGMSGSSTMDISVLSWWNVGPFFVSVMKILRRSSRRSKKPEMQEKLGDL